MSERLINEMTATEIRDYLVSGKSSSTDFYERLLAFIDSGDEAIKAFVNRDDRIVNLHAQHLDDKTLLIPPTIPLNMAAKSTRGDIRQVMHLSCGV